MVEENRDLKSHAWPPLILRTDSAHLAETNFSPHTFHNLCQTFNLIRKCFLHQK
jgi:hypothetical protein